jgi:hypothetical protein
MQDRKQIYGKLFLGLSLIGAFFVLTEIVMQSLGKSLCFTGGCKIVAQTVRFGESSLLFLGLLMFFSLAILTALSLPHVRPALERLVNLIIVVSLACEGFFMGYLAFRLHTVCIFCVIVFGLLVALGVLRLLSKQHEVIAGFAALAAIFSLLYLVLPVGPTTNLPENERLILFYSKDCKYCSEVMAELERNKITAKHVEVGAYAGLLNSIGIEGVPTLLVSDPNQKVFFVGEEAIRRYMRVCSETTNAAGKTALKRKPGKASKSSTSSGAELKLDLFTQQGILTGPGKTTPGNGLCKEDEICK